MQHLVAGDVVVIEPGENHHLEADEHDPCINLFVQSGPAPNPKQLG
jgi:quercetin dioxygenase-like cupin family protein